MTSTRSYPNWCTADRHSESTTGAWQTLVSFTDPLPQSTLPPPATELPARSSTPAQRQLFATGTSVPTAEDDDEELVFAASQCEAQLNTEACAGPSPSAETAKTPDSPHHQPPAELPSHWKDHLPPYQHE